MFAGGESAWRVENLRMQRMQNGEYHVEKRDGSDIGSVHCAGDVCRGEGAGIERRQHQV